MCKAFRHVKVDTLSQPEVLSRIAVPGRGRGSLASGNGDAPGLAEMAGRGPGLPDSYFVL